MLHPRRTRLHDVATHVLCAPGDEARVLAGGVDAELDAALAALREAGDAGVVIAGERDGRRRRRAWTVAGDVGARFALRHPPRERPRGAPGRRASALLPGGRTFDEADEVEAAGGR